MLYYNGRNLTPDIIGFLIVLCIIFIGIYYLNIPKHPEISAPEPAGYEINVFYASSGEAFYDTVKIFTRESGLFIVKNYACYRPFTNQIQRVPDSAERNE